MTTSLLRMSVFLCLWWLCRILPLAANLTTPLWWTTCNVLQQTTNLGLASPFVHPSLSVGVSFVAESFFEVVVAEASCENYAPVASHGVVVVVEHVLGMVVDVVGAAAASPRR